MTENTDDTEVFTILYEVRDQKYLIGVTNEEVPVIAALGINTSRPLPQNIKTAIAETVMEMKSLTERPKVIDFNAPSQRFSKTVLGDFTRSPLEGAEKPAKTIEEALTELKTKMRQEADKN